MVNLTRIYTRTGDAGNTRLSDNAEVPKTDLRVEAYGAIDETNSNLALAVAHGGLPERVVEMLALIRNELFDVGADLSTPLHPSPQYPPLRVEQSSIDRLEEWCDELGAELPSLRSFILPGGSPAAAQLHVARTVRRAGGVAGRSGPRHRAFGGTRRGWGESTGDHLPEPAERSAVQHVPDRGGPGGGCPVGSGHGSPAPREAPQPHEEMRTVHRGESALPGR